MSTDTRSIPILVGVAQHLEWMRAAMEVDVAQRGRITDLLVSRGAEDIGVATR